MLLFVSLLVFIFHYCFFATDVFVVASVCAVVALAAADAFNVVANVVVYLFALIHFFLLSEAVVVFSQTDVIVVTDVVNVVTNVVVYINVHIHFALFLQLLLFFSFSLHSPYWHSA